MFILSSSSWATGGVFGCELFGTIPSSNRRVESESIIDCADLVDGEREPEVLCCGKGALERALAILGLSTLVDDVDNGDCCVLGELFLEGLKLNVSEKRRCGSELSPCALVAGVFGVEGVGVRDCVCGFWS